MQNLPNFFLVGAAKAGTTSVYKYMELSKSPEIFIPELKEPSFFAFANENINFKRHLKPKFKLVTNFNEYLSLYKDAKDYKVKGDFSTPYLFFYKKTIQNIKKYYERTDHLKFLIILRNPIDRAISQYMHHVRDLAEDVSFEEAVKLENFRIKENFHFDYFYIKRGFYFKQVKAYLENFKNVKVILFEELKENPYLTMEEIFDFLELDKKYLRNVDFSRKFNVSGEAKFKFLIKMIYAENPILRSVKKVIPTDIRENIKNLIYKYNTKKKKVTISQELKEYLINTYKEDIEKLSNLLDKDLSHWLR